MDFYETVTAYKPGAKILPWPWHKYPAKWGGFFCYHGLFGSQEDVLNTQPYFQIIFP